MDDHLTGFLYSLIYSLPFLFIYFTGFILSFVFRQRLGRVWLVPIFAFLLHMLGTAINIGIQAYFHMVIMEAGNYAAYELIIQLAGILAIFFHIIGYILLFIALFAKREKGAKADL